MAKKNLRAAAPGEKPQVSTVSEAASRGDRLGELRAMRKILARTIDDEKTAPRDLAALTRRLMELSRLIEEEEVQESENAGVASNDASDAKFRPEAV